MCVRRAHPLTVAPSPLSLSPPPPLPQHAALDTNDDGAVDEEEALSRLDADGDGQLNATESSLDFDAFCVDLFDEVGGVARRLKWRGRRRP